MPTKETWSIRKEAERLRKLDQTCTVRNPQEPLKVETIETMFRRSEGGSEVM